MFFIKKIVVKFFKYNKEVIFFIICMYILFLFELNIKMIFKLKDNVI